MATELSSITKALYETDYVKWIEATAAAIKQGNLAAVDWDNLLEEIEDMGRSERRKLESNLKILILHLLKWQFQPERRSNSWRATIAEHRQRIRKSLKESPSLKPYLDTAIAENYGDAVELAAIETGLPEETFPQKCLFTSVQLTDPEFLPEEA
jgi:hypothetical protein